MQSCGFKSRLPHEIEARSAERVFFVYSFLRIS